MKKTFIVQGLGFWGGGPTLREAALNAKTKGFAKNSYEVSVKLVIGDDKARIVNNGMNIEHLSHCIVEEIGTGFKIGQLIKLRDKNYDNKKAIQAAEKAA